MPLIVQKFGGTSVANPEKILKAARRAIRAQQEGNQVVMVVSAMGHSTDELIDLARQITDKPPAREMDMLLSTGEQISCALLAMAVKALGHDAISLTGAQVGIKTDREHTQARIKTISAKRIFKALKENKFITNSIIAGLFAALLIFAGGMMFLPYVFILVAVYSLIFLINKNISGRLLKLSFVAIIIILVCH